MCLAAGSFLFVKTRPFFPSRANLLKLHLRNEIFAAVIQWHRPRRGGYQPPGYFPHGEITSAQSADNAIPNIFKRNSAVSCRNIAILQYCYIIQPIWFCSIICYVGGRILSAPTEPTASGVVRILANINTSESVGAAISRPVVFSKAKISLCLRKGAASTPPLGLCLKTGFLFYFAGEALLRVTSW